MQSEFKDENTKVNQSKIMKMPIKATPYQHQVRAFNFVCRLFGLTKGGDENPSIRNSANSASLLMEM